MKMISNQNCISYLWPASEARYTIVHSVCMFCVCSSEAAVSVHLSDELLEGVVTQLLAQLTSGKGLKADVVRLYIQALGNIRLVMRA
jgi:hypothetical protein